MSQKQTQGRMWDMSSEPRQDFLSMLHLALLFYFPQGNNSFKSALSSIAKPSSTALKFNSTQVGSRDRTGQLLRKAMNAF